jgi:hypothetical protein
MNLLSILARSLYSCQSAQTNRNWVHAPKPLYGDHCSVLKKKHSREFQAWWKFLPIVIADFILTTCISFTIHTVTLRTAFGNKVALLLPKIYLAKSHEIHIWR